MSSNKLAEKTKKVLEKQSELTSLIDDLKAEVGQIYFENKKLAEENQKLQEKLALFERNEPATEEKKPDIVEEKKPEVLEEKPVEIKEVKPEVAIQPEKPVEVHQPRIIKKKPEKEPNPIFEFFLGKNIIAKIAAVLIFLGIITFGQMAYDWLPEIGKFILILATGAIFFGVGVFAENKKAIVFSNVFYIIGLAIVFYSFLLASISFELFNKNILAYILVGLMAATWYYFREKRNEFLDLSLFAFYLVVGFTYPFLVKGNIQITLYIEVSLTLLVLGFIMYMYYSKYFQKQNRAIVLSQVFVAIATIVFVFSRPFSLEVVTNPQLYISWIFIAFGLFVAYVVNIVNKPESEVMQLFIPISSTIQFSLLSLALAMIVSIGYNIENPSIFVFTFIIVLTPLYVFLYRRRKENPIVVNYYVLILATFLLLYSFVAGAFNREVAFDFYVQNIILAVEILIFYALSKITKESIHRYISYVFIGVLLVRNLNYYAFESDFTFASSNVLFVTLGMALLLFGVNTFFRYVKQQENQIDNVVVNGLLVITLVPFMMIFTNDLLSDDSAYIMAMVMLLLVGYRWLMEVDIFRMFYKKHFVLGMNIAILLLTFSLNLVYFDHDFSKFEDVFKLLFMFVVNVYVVYALREIYVGYCKTENVERNFIILYGIGVLIHSYYIHRYINIEFDKVILSSYFLIASAVGVLAGFRQGWSITRRIGLAAIYYSLGKFFIYDFYTQDFSDFVRMVTYFILGFILLGISFLYAYLERVYGQTETIEES